MQANHTRSVRLGRKTRFAQALALALALGSGAALAASPQSAANQHSSAQGIGQILKSSQSTGSNSALPVSGDFSAPRSTTAPPDWTVTDCSDSGPGTLRSIVDNYAGDGDTIDLSGCSTITLQSSIVSSVDNLTLVGDLSDSSHKYGVLDGNNAVRPLRHTGSGTLTLDNVMVRFGYEAGPSGGCIFSTGNVSLKESTVKYCTVKNTSGNAWGGGVDALGDVSLQSSVIQGNKAIGSTGAFGGGVYAGGNVGLGFAKYNEIKSNKATVTGSSGDAMGGGIYAGGDLTDLSGSTFSGNKVAGPGRADGGAAYVGGGANMALSTITGNSADGTGGGLYVLGDLDLTQVVASGNSAKLGGGVFAKGTSSIDQSTFAGNDATLSGGGLRLNGNVSISNSTISGNTSAHVAGAVLGKNATAPVSIEQSTVSGNVASNSVWGAGLYLAHETMIKNSTITENVESNSGDNRHGAGISLASNVALTLSSCIVSGNYIKWGNGNELPSAIGLAGSSSGGSLSGNYNVLGTLVNATLTAPSNTISANDPELETLKDNGGPTLTHMPLEGSPAISWGLENGFATDQRGSGYARKIGSFADAGSVEAIDYSDVIFRDGFEQ